MFLSIYHSVIQPCWIRFSGGVGPNGCWALRTIQEGWNRSLNKNAKNRTERDDHSSTQNGTERERNDFDEGPRSRTEQKDFKKIGTCPALQHYDICSISICSVGICSIPFDLSSHLLYTSFALYSICSIPHLLYD